MDKLNLKSIDEVERRLKALEFINAIKAEIDKYDWQPLGDCPMIKVVPNHIIQENYKKCKQCRICGIDNRRH